MFQQKAVGIFGIGLQDLAFATDAKNGINGFRRVHDLFHEIDAVVNRVFSRDIELLLTVALTKKRRPTLILLRKRNIAVGGIVFQANGRLDI